MEYPKGARILRLVPWLQSSLAGITYDDIAEEYNVGRKTVARMLADVDAAYPGGLEEVRGAGRKKRWRMRLPPLVRSPVALTPEDLTALDMVQAICVKDGREDLVYSLHNVKIAVEALLKHDAGSHAFGQDAEDLAAAEGLIMRPGPRLRVDPAVMHALRECILKYERARIHHNQKGDYLVEPYGFLYGKRHYLVAYIVDAGKEDPVLFALTELSQAEPTGEIFEARKGFDLCEYAQRSFGVFQGDTIDVVWRFSPKAAPDARKYIFHPNQKQEEGPDGSLIVRFTASGQLEMAHHLLTWDGEVEVLEPPALRELVVELAAKAVEAQVAAG